MARLESRTDAQTHFNSAAFIVGHTVEHVWDAFLFCWATQYTGFPMPTKTDQGSCFTSLRWTRRCNAVGTEMEINAVESHSSLGSGDRYHEPLRRVFHKTLDDHAKMKRDLVLRLAIKSCNDTLGTEGFVHSLLVFGCTPLFPSVDSTVPE